MLKNKNWTCVVAQENKQRNKILVCSSDPKKEVDQEYDAADRAAQEKENQDKKTGSV